MAEHTSPYEALVYVVDGEMEITIGGILHSIATGEYIVMPPNIPHG